MTCANGVAVIVRGKWLSTPLNAHLALLPSFRLRGLLPALSRVVTSTRSPIPLGMLWAISQFCSVGIEIPKCLTASFCVNLRLSRYSLRSLENFSPVAPLLRDTLSTESMLHPQCTPRTIKYTLPFHLGRERAFHRGECGNRKPVHVQGPQARSGVRTCHSAGEQSGEFFLKGFRPDFVAHFVHVEKVGPEVTGDSALRIDEP